MVKVKLTYIYRTERHVIDEVEVENYEQLVDAMEVKALGATTAINSYLIVFKEPTDVRVEYEGDLPGEPEQLQDEPT